MSHEGASLLKKHTHIQSLFCPFRALCFFFWAFFFLPDIWWSVWSQSSFRNVTKIRALDSFQSRPLLTSREGPLIVSRPREDLITVKTGTIDCGVELEPDNVESVSEFGMKRANGKGKELITADERFPPRFVLCLVASWHFRFVVNIGGQMWKKNLHVSSLRCVDKPVKAFLCVIFLPPPIWSTLSNHVALSMIRSALQLLATVFRQRDELFPALGHYARWCDIWWKRRKSSKYFEGVWKLDLLK